VSGYVTKDKFIRGRTVQQIEQILGFHPGRFRSGIAVVLLNRLPTLAEFELAAYSITPEHRFQRPTDLNIDKLKKMAAESWSLIGLERLVKVQPAIPHDPDVPPDKQYPPGLGAPQWKLKVKIPGTVIAVIGTYPEGRYRPAS